MVSRLAILLATLAVVAACGTDRAGSGPAPTAPMSSVAAPPTTPIPAPPVPTTPAPQQQTQKWTDLTVGQCLAELPPVDLTEQDVTVVDCTTTHQAEVYLRAPVKVDAAIADVADQKCAAGLAAYTGRATGAGQYTVTYLIDSDQNRTSSNPDPSTVICLLQATGGGPLTRSARR